EVEPAGIGETGSEANADAAFAALGADTVLSRASVVLTADSPSQIRGDTHSGPHRRDNVLPVDARGFTLASVPIVRRPWTKFTVTAEFVTLAPSGTRAGAGPSEPGPMPVAEKAVPVLPWPQPMPQSRGPEWIYDAFTPPEILFHVSSRQFTVRPPESLLPDEAGGEFGLELVSVRSEPFRLQLIGYAGGDGTWCGTFENEKSGEVIVAGSGRQIPKLGLTIRRVDVRTQPLVLAQSMTTLQRVATAVVQDDRSGRQVVLPFRERGFDGTATAVVLVDGETKSREVRAAEVLGLGSMTYRIDRVHLAPPAIEVTKESVDLPPERRTLFPRGNDEPEEAGGIRSGESW
ncbi:MAG: hypothetical protein WD941_08630, partial [Opitutus sp.]